MPAIITPKTVSINGNLYSTKEDVKGGWIDPFPEQQQIGDADYSNRRDLSSWIITPPLYIGVEEMEERKDANRCWWTDCIVSNSNHILPPRLATSLGALPTPTIAGNPIFCNYNGINYMATGSTLSKLNAGRTAWTAVKTDFGAAITALVSSINGKLYIFLGSDNASASDTLLQSVDTEYTSTSITAVKLSEQTAITGGTLRIKFDLKGHNQPATGYGRIYRNGVAVGTLQSVANGTYVTKSEDISGWTEGDLIQLYGYTSDTLYAMGVRNFRVYGTYYPYWSMTTAEAFTVSNRYGKWAYQSDAKLFRVNTSGAAYYSTDPDATTPTWTSADSIDDIAAQIETFVPNGRNAAGTTTPYAATHSILKAYDSTTPKWVDTTVSLPDYPTGGRGALYWNGALYLSYGLAVKEFIAETGAIREIGLTVRDGLPAEYNCEITKLADGGKVGMFAAGDANIPSGNSKSSLMLWDGAGWTCWWTSASVLIDDCEDAWNELVDADVTASLDTTDFQVGAGSAKFVCAAGLAAGDIIATEVIASKDLSGCSHVSFRFKSTVALSAGDLQVLLDNTASCASPLETLNIPALAANTWTKVDISLAAAASDTAIISVGLKMVVDKGAFTINIDQITGEAYNEAMHDIIVSSASSGYAVYWDAGVNSYYIDIPRGIVNPDKITQSYATSGILIMPWFDAGNQTAAKLAKMLADFAKGITTTETVALKYRLDHTYTDLDTGWTTMDTLNTTGESGYNEELFASGAGLSFKAIQFRLDFVTGGSTAKADIQSLVHYYKKRTGSVKLRVWDITVICNDEHNTSAKNKVDNLKTAIELATDVAFAYHSDGTTNTSYYVSVNCPDFAEPSGLNYDGAEYKLRLIES